MTFQLEDPPSDCEVRGEIIAVIAAAVASVFAAHVMTGESLLA